LKKKIPEIDFIEEIPLQGISQENLRQRIKLYKQADIVSTSGKNFAYNYDCLQQEITDFMNEIYIAFGFTNALSPIAYPSISRIENEIVTMVSNILGGDKDTVGNVATGGTEAILLAIKTYRDRARELYGITHPEIVLPFSAHPAFQKAGHYFSCKLVYVPLNKDFEVDLKAMRKAITRNTILLVGSAPQYPNCVMDPIEKIAALALENHLPLHVDSCLGGLILPWLKKSGYSIPDFDLRVKGVTSISADIHKYGFSQKGTAVILYRNESYRKYQIFTYTKWPGGLYASTTLLGSRNGGIIAVGWAALCLQGQAGFIQHAKRLMETAQYLISEISKIPELYILGKPCMPIISFGAKGMNIYVIADLMEREYGWKLERQQFPPSCHLTLTPPHNLVKEKLIQDLNDVVEKLRENPNLTTDGSALLFKTLESLPSRSLAEDYLATYFGKIYSK